MMPKVVLITGASSGLGLALGNLLHARGYRVYGSSRNPDGHPLPFPLLAMDVADAASVRKAVEQILSREGRLDVLVNNAGVGMGAPLESGPVADVRSLFETNVFGVLNTCQAVLPVMRAAGGGRIINISSIAGSIGLPYRGAYCASKAALDMFGETLRMELKRFGIEVATILAGDIRTPIKSHWIGRYRPEEDPVYGRGFSRAVAAAGAEVDKGMAPEEVARQLERIIGSARLRKSYVVAKPLQRFSLLVRWLLPPSSFEKVIMRYSKV